MNKVNQIVGSSLLVITIISGVTVNTEAAFSKSKQPGINKIKKMKRTRVCITKRGYQKGYVYKKNFHAKLFKLNKLKNMTLYSTRYVKNVSSKTTYYYITSSNKKYRGWVYRGYLKKVSTSKTSSSKKTDNYYKNLANQMTKDARKKASSTTGTKTSTKPSINTNTNSGSKTPATKPSTPKMSEAQYNSEVASDFISALNVERSQRGLALVTNENGGKTQSIATARIPQVLSQQTAGQSIDLEHDYAGHDAAMVLSKQLGFDGIASDETLSGIGDNSQMVMNTMTPSQVSHRLLHELIYEDAGSDNGHRDTLLSKNGTHIGIAVGQVHGSVLIVTEQDVK